jgi:hypothetical protein
MRKALCITILAALAACSSGGPKPLPQPSGEVFQLNRDRRGLGVNDLVAEPAPALLTEAAR